MGPNRPQMLAEPATLYLGFERVITKVVAGARNHPEGVSSRDDDPLAA